MKVIGESIAFVGLCTLATALEVCGNPAPGLWLLVFVWLLLYRLWAELRAHV